MKNSFKIVLLIALLFTSSRSFSQDWEQTNGPFGGDIRSLTVSSNGYVFAGTKGGGVLRTTNDGEEWVKVNSGLTGMDVHALAVNSNGHIFAGALDGGVFRSTNNGGSWTQVN